MASSIYTAHTEVAVRFAADTVHRGGYAQRVARTGSAADTVRRRACPQRLAQSDGGAESDG